MNQPDPPASPLTAERSPWLRGPVRLPGDPLFAQLALSLAALARSESVLENLGEGAAVEAVIAALSGLGPQISRRNGRCHVQGIGVGGFLAPEGPIDLGAAGPGALLMLGLLAAHDFDARVTGLGAAPMADALLTFLGRNGVRVDRDGPTATLRGPRFPIPLDLAVSAEARALIGPLLLQSLVIAGRSALHLPQGITDPAETLLAAFGARLTVTPEGETVRVAVDGLSPLRAQALAIPGDAMLAVYPVVAALIAPDSEITVESVALSPAGLALLDALALLGGDIALNESARGGPGVADLAVRHGQLTGAVIPADPLLAPADYPILTVAAAFAEGETLFEGLGEGTHRLALTRALRANGVECGEEPGGLMVRGQPRVAGGGNVAVNLDPKLAMSFLVLGMGADQPVTIDDGAVMARLFPDFVAAFEHIGASFSTGGAP
jgi:3-phosphoshikimate 1-carboxyvinyltransferase